MKLHSHYFMSIHLDWYICISIYIICTRTGAPNCRLMNEQDERNQVLTTNCWMSHQWRDANLAWNHTNYSHIQSIRLPVEQVWSILFL